MDLQILVVLDGIDTAVQHFVEQHRLQAHPVGPGVVEEFVDGGVELGDVGHHVVACIGIGHTHLGFQAQPGEWRTQVV